MSLGVANGSQMRDIDRITIQDKGIPGLTLMENAGTGVARAIRKHLGPLKNKKMLVVCGKGNNGGDGMVVARLLVKECDDMNIFVLADYSSLKGDALENYKRAKEKEIRIFHIQDVKYLSGVKDIIPNSDIIVDAIFGTGISGPIEGFYAEIIDIINSSGKKIVSIDLPSGLSSDTGELFEPSINACLSVTLGLPKVPCFVYPAASKVGALETVDIGIPDDVVNGTDVKLRLIEKKDVSTVLPQRKRDAHKGDFGHALIVGGSPGKSGAVIMAADAAVRSGAGLVTAVVPKSLNNVMECALLEAMSLPLAETSNGTLSAEGAEKLLDFMAGKSVVAIGPGIGTDDETFEFLKTIIAGAHIPLILDADAINLVSKNTSILDELKAPLILTPHPGEMGNLAGISTSDVQKRRLETCINIASMYNATVILKGKNSIISHCGKGSYINPTGNPGMAAGGSGDVLTGIIAGLVSQKIVPESAAFAGTFIHGLAGDIAACKTGEISLLARDILEHIPDAIKECQEE